MFATVRVCVRGYGSKRLCVCVCVHMCLCEHMCCYDGLTDSNDTTLFCLGAAAQSS